MRGIAIAVLMVVMIGVVGCGTNDNPTVPATNESGVPATTVGTTVTPTEVSGTDDTTTDTGGTVGDEQAYLTFFLEITDGYAAAFRTFSDLNERAGADTDLLVDADWVREAQASAADIDTLSQRILDYDNIPERFAPAHAKLETAADKFKQAMSRYRDGLDTIDVDATTQAFSLIGEGTAIVQDATQEITGLLNNNQ